MTINSLHNRDLEIAQIIQAENQRQHESIELIASENFVSKTVLEAQGSILTNKYAEGYPGKRYYSGCEKVDKIEILAIERAKKLFKCNYVNVQPHSGSQANQAVYLALLAPGDAMLGMSLNSGGHLTHGATPNFSGKWFKSYGYEVHPVTHEIDYDNVEEIAFKTQPKIIIAGYSAYSRRIDWKRFRDIADKVGAYLMADIAHIAGLVATGAHPDPLPHAHVVTSTTHKTLRGPRGGIIYTNDEVISKKINSAVFPGLQGGPLMHVIAAKAVAFGEALTEDYKNYINQVVLNARALNQALSDRGYDSLTNGTDNHLILLDLRKQNLTGNIAANSLNRAGITCNKNAVPFDTVSPFITSGIRLGSPACTTRGFKELEFKIVGNLIADILDGLQLSEDIVELERDILQKVLALTSKFPIYK